MFDMWSRQRSLVLVACGLLPSPHAEIKSVAPLIEYDAGVAHNPRVCVS
jgi:hypothetical protein